MGIRIWQPQVALALLALSCGRTGLEMEPPSDDGDTALVDSGGGADVMDGAPESGVAPDAGAETEVGASDAPVDVVADAPQDSATDAGARDAGCGSVTFSAPVAYPVSDWATAIAIGDLDRDGLPDLIVADEPDTYPTEGASVSVLHNLGGRQFGPEEPNPGDSIVEAIQVADMNGDGWLDVVTSNRQSFTVGVYLNAGNGKLLPQATYQAGAGVDGGMLWPGTLAVGDLNGDGLPDVAVAEQDLYLDTNTDNGGGVGVWLNLGGGVLGPEVLLPNVAITGAQGGTYTRGPATIAIADLDAHGTRDIVVTTIDGRVAVYGNHGDGTFAPEIFYSIGGQGPSGCDCRLSVADLNGDGHPDLAVTNASGPAVGVLLNDGTGAFLPEVTVVAGTDFWGTNHFLAVTDLQRRGLDDIITAGYAPSSSNPAFINPAISRYPILGAATFGPAVVYSPDPTDFLEDLAVGDVDGDGLPDVALVSQRVFQAEVLYSSCQ